MIRYALRCENGHVFESWFQSAAGYDALRAAGQVTCALCGSVAVDKAPMAPAVPVRGDASDPGPLSRPPSPDEARLASLRDHVERHSEYVGDAFVGEARAIHAGERPDRSIHGEARLDDARRLLEEGIPIAPLPFRPRRKVS